MKRFLDDAFILAAFVWEVKSHELLLSLHKVMLAASGETIRTNELRDMLEKHPAEEWEDCEMQSVGYALEALALHDEIQSHPAARAFRVMQDVLETRE